VWRPAGHVFSEQHDFPGTRGEDPGNQVEKRGLAGAVRADDGLALAGKNFEGDLAYRREAAEALRELF